ncbi:hypothetical protein SADUNF_Sadunf03G0074600 [Salix dunnii]|uniref:Myb-like domain-containing protein n=1 Tax=Salix dunnii TaxID=1413687 RepID=A0A835KGP0_9ROSI|nr:hypothetical protein SADUNF_Sadunf03G0074600 [Salix dunnii]
MMFRRGGGEGDAGLGPINMMPIEAMLSPKAEISPRGPPLLQPQWGLRETEEFIGIRAELKKDFTVTKRNKTLWEMVSARMGEKGYRRTPGQCKCKWKNLVNLYKVLFSLVFESVVPCLDVVSSIRDDSVFSRKGCKSLLFKFYVVVERVELKVSLLELCLHALDLSHPLMLPSFVLVAKDVYTGIQGKETPDPETVRQCLFYDELHEVFTGRAKNGQRVLLESEAGSTRSRKKARRIDEDRSSDEFSEEDEDESEEKKPARSNSRKRKGGKIVAEKSPRASDSSVGGGVREMLKEFFQQQLVMEMQWRELVEKRAHEWQMFEQEWRQSMDKLERERLMIEQAWREREEQRRIRGESRAERRDALLTTLLNKLIGENDM